MDPTSTMLKIAYLRGLDQALEEHSHELGFDADLIKEAFLTKMLGAAGKMLGRQTLNAGSAIARAGGRGVKAMAGAGSRGVQSRLPGIGRALYTPATRAAPAADAVAKGVRGFMGMAPKGEMLQGAKGLLPELGRFGKNLVGGGMGNSGKNMSKAYKALTFGGRNVPSQMLQYGTISGGIGGLTGGKPGEGWSWSGAGKGFLGGAAGGLGWAAGGRLAKGGIGKLLGSKAALPGGRLAGLADRAKNVSGIGVKGPSFWGQKAWDTTGGKSFKQLWKNRPTGGAGQSVLSGLGSTAKDMGLKAGLAVPTVGAALGTSLGTEEGANQLMNRTQSATSPESMMARGAFAMTPQARYAAGY